MPNHSMGITCSAVLGLAAICFFEAGCGKFDNHGHSYRFFDPGPPRDPHAVADLLTGFYESDSLNWISVQPSGEAHGRFRVNGVSLTFQCHPHQTYLTGDLINAIAPPELLPIDAWMVAAKSGDRLICEIGYDDAVLPAQAIYYLTLRKVTLEPQ